MVIPIQNFQYIEHLLMVMSNMVRRMACFVVHLLLAIGFPIRIVDRAAFLAMISLFVSLAVTVLVGVVKKK